MSRHKKFSSVGKVLNPSDLFKTTRTIKRVVVHCTATGSTGNTVDADMVDRWHRDRWGSGIGYHYLVKRDGTLEKGRWVDFIGSHAKGSNQGSIGICYSGGVKLNPSFVKGSTKYSERQFIPDEDSLTKSQYSTLLKLTNTLCSLYSISHVDVIGHREISNKDCPCMDMDKFRGAVCEKQN